MKKLFAKGLKICLFAVLLSFVMTMISAPVVKADFFDDVIKQVEQAPDTQAYQGSVTFEVGPGVALPENLRPLFEKLALDFSLASTMDPSDEFGKLDLALNLYDKGDKDGGLKINLYNVKDQIIFDAPGVLPKGILFNEESLKAMTGQSDLGLNQLSTGFNAAAKEKMLAVLQEAKGIQDKLLPYFADGAPAKENVELEGISEELTVNSKVLPADKTPEFLKTLLTEIKNSASIKDFIQFSNQVNTEVGDPIEEMDKSLDQALTDIETNPAKYQVPVTLATYADANGEPRGFSMSMEKEGSTMQLRAVEVAKEAAHAFKLGVVADNLDMMSLDAAFDVNDAKLASGKFSAKFYGQELMSGSFDQLKVNMDNAANPFIEGQVTCIINANDVEKAAGEESPSEPQQVLVKYLGSVKDGNYNVSLQVAPNAKLEDQYIKLNLTARIVPIEEVKFPAELPAEYYDLNNPDQMSALSSDSNIMQNLMGILDKLGLSQFMQ